MHSYLGSAALGVMAVVDGARWTAFVALVWRFHIAVLGYGLKFCERFTHTHLGEVGGGRRSDEP